MKKRKSGLLYLLLALVLVVCSGAVINETLKKYASYPGLPKDLSGKIDLTQKTGIY